MSRLTRGGGPYIFYDLLGGLQDLDLHLLAPQAALELLDPGLRRAQETGRDDILVGGHGGGSAGFHSALPLPDHRGLNVELPAHFGQGLLPFQDLLDHPALDQSSPTPCSMSSRRRN